YGRLDDLSPDLDRCQRRVAEHAIAGARCETARRREREWLIVVLERSVLLDELARREIFRHAPRIECKRDAGLNLATMSPSPSPLALSDHVRRLRHPERRRRFDAEVVGELSYEHAQDVLVAAVAVH